LTRTKLEILTRNELAQIHDASLEVLASAEVRVDDYGVCEMLREAGAQVDESKGIVKIPKKLVHEALRKALEEFALYDRLTEYDEL
jgi:trimethylamine--corrinoid protein Co-methyltransferase